MSIFFLRKPEQSSTDTQQLHKRTASTSSTSSRRSRASSSNTSPSRSSSNTTPASTAPSSPVNSSRSRKSRPKLKLAIDPSFNNITAYPTLLSSPPSTQKMSSPTKTDSGFTGKGGLPMPGLSGVANGPVGNLLKGPVDANGKLKDAALMVGIKLDLEAEVHLTARIRGDILVGLY